MNDLNESEVEKKGRQFRKSPPKGISVTPPVAVHELRSKILRDLDAANPDFVHMYQSPDIFGDKAKVKQWEMEVKGQEVVKGEDGQFVHHMGDPVVRVKREKFVNDRMAEVELSKRSLEGRTEIKDKIHKAREPGGD